jgi:PAS domain S-box-containing protein
MASLDGNALDQSLARAGDGVCVVDIEGRVLLWNRAAERILGYTAREATGRPCCEVFLGRDDNGNRLCFQNCHVMSLVKMSEPIQHFEMRTETKAGQKVWLDMSVLSLSPARNGNGSNGTNGNGTMVVHLFRDVTATKELITLIHERLSAAASPTQTLEAAAALTRRELEVLRMVATGLNTKAIAERLHVSPATIRNHVQNILGKLGAHSRLEAVAHATRHRLL